MSTGPESVFSDVKLAKTRIGPVAADKKQADDALMAERVAKLEATIDTIRAELRAGAAETREAVVTAVERLRADTNRDVLGVKIWILSGVVVGLLGLIGAGWWIAQQYLIPILQHTG